MSGQTIAVGVGELAVSSDPGAVLVTHALGSCVAVCIWDAWAGVAGLLHFLLPESGTHVARARLQPEAFGDRGIPLLFEKAGHMGLQKNRAVVWLVGGAEIAESSVARLKIGSRNLAAARRLLSSDGIAIEQEMTGGVVPRSVYLSAATGQLRVRTGRETVVVE